jgi:hypothetical protein
MQELSPVAARQRAAVARILRNGGIVFKEVKRQKVFSL